MCSQSRKHWVQEQSSNMPTLCPYPLYILISDSALEHVPKCLPSTIYAARCPSFRVHVFYGLQMWKASPSSFQIAGLQLAIHRFLKFAFEFFRCLKLNQCTRPCNMSANVHSLLELQWPHLEGTIASALQADGNACMHIGHGPQDYMACQPPPEDWW